MGDKNIENAKMIAEIMNNAGFDVEAVEMDLSSRKSIKSLIAKAQEYGEIKMLVNGAGVSPSQAPIEAILKVDLYGTADEVANVAELLMSEKGAFITGSTFLMDGGATASYYYGPLKPEN